MKTRSVFKKLWALTLALTMLITVLMPITASAISLDTSKLGSDMYLTSKTDYAVAPGISESQVTINNSTGSNQTQGYALEVDLSNPTVSILSSYKDYNATSWGMQKVRDQAYAAEKKLGINVVAGVNGDFYNMQTGAPIGTLVMNGVTYNKNFNYPYFAILKDGTAKIGRKATEAELASFKECIGGSLVLVEDGKPTAGAVTGTQLPRTVVGIKADGNVILYVVDGRQAPNSCGMNYIQLAHVMISLGCVTALNLDGGGSATLISQHEGSEELVCRNSPSDGAERSVSTALLVASSATPTGVFDHATITPNNELYTPGSNIQFTAIGVDSAGTNAPLPEDGTFVLEDSSYGSITSGGLFTSTGKLGTVTVSYMSGGKNCGSVSIEIVVPDEFYVPTTEVSLGFEDTTDFGLRARYENVEVNLKPGDINWEIKDLSGNDLGTSAGTFDGLTFTTLDGVTVTANVTATNAHDESISVTLRAVIGAMPVVMYDFEGYTTDLAEAEADESLTYIPSFNMPRFDRSKGTVHTAQAAEFYEQGYPLYCWPNEALVDQDSMKVTIVSKDDGYPVRFGDHSLKIDYDYSTYNASSNANNYLRVTCEDYIYDGSPTAIGCWVYIPEGTANFRIYLNSGSEMASGDPNAVYKALTERTVEGKVVDTGLYWTGWKYCEFDLTSIASQGPFGFYQGCGIFWISYQPGNKIGDKTASTLYLDNIQLIYGANTDDVNNPEIKSIRTDDAEIEDGVTVFTANANTIKASYGDVEAKYATGIDFDEVKMFIDGVDVTDKCYINVGDEEIYYYDLVLADGVHSVTISVSDLFGNNTTETRFFTVDSGSEATKVTFAAVDESPVLGEDYTMAVTTDNPADILSADISVNILSYFTQYWTDYRVELNPNYTLEAEPVYDANTSTISFKAVRNADATSANDDGTIAKIIIAIPTDVPEGLEVIYNISKGGLTYAEDKGEKFGSSFSGRVVTTCAAPFAISTDTMVVGTAGGNIYVTDAEGNPVAGAEIFTTSNVSLGVTDANGALFTNSFISRVAQFSIYAKLETKLSFIYTSQSFPSGGNASGLPSYIKLNASVDPSTTQSISWMANPGATKGEAVILYAEKAAFEANGELAFTEFKGESNLIEMSSSPTIVSNYAVRINNALVTGLKPGTEYVYMAGDGELMSDVKSFSTSRKGEAVNFFVIGDTQATDTTNTDEITKNLSESGVNYAFGIQTGDAIDNGGNYPMWANIAQVFSGDFLGTQDLVQVLGNHEYYGDLQGTNAAYYFGLPGVQNESAPKYYSVQYGNVYVAVINFSDDMNDYAEAAQWLIQDAANATATWKILAMHQPSYFTNRDGGNESIRGIIAPAVDAADIDVVFSGHDHSYARTKPMTDGKVDDDGAVYYICGSTGEKSYLITPNDDFNFDTLSSDFNAIYLTVSATDTELNIQTRNYMADGTEEIIDQCIRHKNVTCTESGHEYVYADGYLTCSVCGYALTIEGYTGFAVNAQGASMYFINGTAMTGWFTLGEDQYYFNQDGAAQTGVVTVDGHSYTFGEDGKMIKGALERNSDGTYSYYINGEKQRGWHQIDGYWYFFSRSNDNKSVSGMYTITNMMYTFDINGRLIVGAWSTTDTGKCYYWGPSPVIGLQEIEGETYYFYPSNTYMCTTSVEIDGVVYAFASDGKFVHNGEHADADGDGRCDICDENQTVVSTIRSLFQRIAAFFRNILRFFGLLN